MKEAKRQLFAILNRINKMILPSMVDKDLTRLTRRQKAIVAWRYWVVINSLKD